MRRVMRNGSSKGPMKKCEVIQYFITNDLLIISILLYHHCIGIVIECQCKRQ